MLRLALNTVPAKFDTTKTKDTLPDGKHELLEAVPADIQRPVLARRYVPRRSGTRRGSQIVIKRARDPGIRVG